MSTLTPERPVAQRRPVDRPAATQPVTFARVVHSEWLKFRTLRSSWLTLLAAVLAMIVIALVASYNIGKNFSTMAPEDQAPSGPLQGYYLAQLLIGVLGVLFVSGEYTTGMIRSTFAAVPRRTPVVLAKTLVFGVIALVSMVLASVVAFFCAQGFLGHYGHSVSIGDPGVLRVVLGTGAYLALIGLLGGALAWILRSTPGGISAVVGLVLVIPVIFQLLPGTWSKDIGQFLPSAAGGSFVSSLHTEHTLSPWTGLAVLTGWVAVSLLVAVGLLKHRDV